MKISTRSWAAALGLAVCLSWSPAQAGLFKWLGSSEEPAPSEAKKSVAASYASYTLVNADGCCEACDACGDCCDACGDDCCGGCGACGAACDDCPGLGIIGTFGLDNYRGFTDGTWPGNFGLVSGLNVGSRLPGLSRYGIGGQLGLSYGLYDLQGRSTGENARSQEQLFITTGFFRRADANNPLVMGLAYDWMINDNFGVFSREPFLGQWRGQLGVALSAANEVGWWGAFHDRRDQQGGIAFRTVSQQNMYWRHQFVGGANSLLYVGIPERNRLTGGGSLGEWIVGGGLTVPLTARLGTYINFAYMCPSAPAGPVGQREETYQLGAGLAFFPGRTSRSSTVAGRCWMPLMPVATNGTMMTDTSNFQ